MTSLAILTRKTLLLGALLAVAAACSDDSTNGGNPPITDFTGDFAWSCADGESCQDVFEFQVTAGTQLFIEVTQVSAGSVSQIALYGPGVPLGGTNLLTGTTNELRCTVAGDCGGYTAGESVGPVVLAASGTYRVAVTRDWGFSCANDGTYHLQVTASEPFTPLGQTVQDENSAAPGYECL